jgi:hypothetical protein
MLQITTNIVVHSTKRFATCSFTEKVCYLSWICLICSMILVFMGFGPGSFTGLLALFGFILFIIGMTGPLFETEPLYGTLTEAIIITEDGITYQNNFHPFNSLQDFKIEMKSFYRQQTGNSRWGPKYFRGINNRIFFISDNAIVHDHFLISSGTEFDVLQEIIDQAIVKEKLSFRHSYLDMVSDSYKQTEEYRQLIQKIKHKNPTFVS